MRFRQCAVICAAAILIAPALAQAQFHYDVLHEFPSRGSGPTTITQGADGALYGTTRDGGRAGGGTIFRVSATGDMTILHDFEDPSGGQGPEGRMVQGADGAFYGTANAGPAGAGLIFRITPEGVFSIAHVFDGTDGQGPTPTLVIGRDGALYGASRYGGYGSGTLFKLATDCTFTVLHVFEYSDGNEPTSLVQGNDDAWYGTTFNGGDYGEGVVFRLDADGTLQVLHTFDYSDGSAPMAPLTLSASGAFYGTTQSGGEIGSGTVFRITADGTFALLHEFSGIDGEAPDLALTETSDGNFYGVTRSGGASGIGTVFTVAPDGTFTSVYSFSGPDGERPSSRLVLAANGSLYGTTEAGGNSAVGVIFKVEGGVTVPIHSMGDISFDGATLTQELIRGSDDVLYGVSEASTVFAIDADLFRLIAPVQSSEGQQPKGALLEGPDGLLYGTTQFGGAFGGGILFRMTTTGMFEQLHSFTPAERNHPFGGMVSLPDGVYGATVGESDAGSIYRVTPAGVYSIVHEFNYTTGAFPLQGIIKGPDAAIYGLLMGGGPDQLGGIFRLGDGGTFTMLHLFTPAEGRPLAGTLSVGADGMLYGVNTFGVNGLNFFTDAGTVYRMTTDGVFTLLHTFDVATGKWPYAPPVAGSDGAMYGTTARGGAFNGGTVYKVTQDGTFSVLHEFDRINGEEPLATLSMGPGGDLYGVTLGSMTPADRGTVFKVTSEGVVTLHKFTGPDGGELQSQLVGTPTEVFGVTRGGGLGSAGTVFSLNAAGDLETLHAFNGEDGNDPDTALMMASDGALYGTTSFGGSGNGGVVFRLALTPPDTTAPTVVAHATSEPNAAGWYSGDVVVTFTCNDEGGSGIPDGACPADQILSGEGAITSTSVTVTDGAGNVSAPSNVVEVNIDKTAPTLAPVVSPTPVLLNGVADAAPMPADNGSGVDHATCDPMTTSSVGTKSVTCTAVDRAGNTASVEVSYEVVYRFDGFQQPINDPANSACGNCQQSVFKAGSNVPVKFQLKDSSGAIVTSSALPQWITPIQVGSSAAPVNETVDPASETSGPTYQLVSDGYMYHWRTTGLPGGSVWRIGVRLDDGRTYTVDVGLK